MLAGKVGFFKASGFDPRSISGLELWLDASNSSSITIGTGVSQWLDVSGKGRSMNQSTASSQPPFSATGLNGRPSVQFTAANARWMSGTWSISMTGQTTFAVASMTSASNGNARLFSQIVSGLSGDFAGTNHYIPLLRSGNNQQTASFASGANVAAVTFPAYSTPFVASSIHNGSQISNRVNNGTAATFNSTLNTTFSTMLLSNYTAAPAGGYLTGFISEVVVFSRALTDAERSTMYAYLGAKWGITVA